MPHSIHTQIREFCTAATQPFSYDIVRNEHISDAGWTTIRVAAGHRRPEIMARLHVAWSRVAAALVLR